MSRSIGKVAFVSGAAGGIGAAIARRLAENGARVMLGDLDLSGAERIAAEIGASAKASHLDVASEESWAAAVRSAIDAFGGLDILVNNAGIALPPPPAFEDIEWAQWRRVMSVNLDGVFLGTREGVRAMRNTPGASIVNIGSVAAFIGTPGGAAYGGSKGGVRALTKQAAVACARNGYSVRINALHPCYVWTPMVEAAAAARWGAEAARENIRALHPFRCLAEPIDVANAVLFLASDESRLFNGADLIMDGGLLAQ